MHLFNIGKCLLCYFAEFLKIFVWKLADSWRATFGNIFNFQVYTLQFTSFHLDFFFFLFHLLIFALGSFTHFLTVSFKSLFLILRKLLELRVQRLLGHYLGNISHCFELLICWSNQTDLYVSLCRLFLSKYLQMLDFTERRRRREGKAIDLNKL